jgi:hypothetical protein
MSPEARMAMRITSLFRDCPPHKPQGTLAHDRYREELCADMPLAAYFAAVIEGGDEAWRQERMAIGRRHRMVPREHRGDPMNLGAVKLMLPIWRRWGQMLLDAGEVEGFTEERFRESNAT